MEQLLIKMARQLDALDEASLLALWDKYAVIVSLSLIIMTPLTGEDLNAVFMRTATSRDCVETTPALFSALAAGAGAVLYIAPVFREDSATGSLSHPMYAMPL